LEKSWLCAKPILATLNKAAQKAIAAWQDCIIFCLRGVLKKGGLSSTLIRQLGTAEGLTKQVSGQARVSPGLPVRGVRAPKPEA
jgi:hypothetical protein